MMRSMHNVLRSLLFLLASVLWAVADSNSGEALYKARCAQCHGRSGEGKIGRKAPSLVSAEVKSMSDGALKDVIQQRTNGEMERRSAHTAMKKRLSGEQVTELVSHIRKLQNQ